MVQWITFIAVSYLCKVIYLYWCKYSHCIRGHILFDLMVMSKVMLFYDLSHSCQRLYSMMTFHSHVKGYVPWWPFSHVKGYVPWWPFTVMSKVMFRDDLSQSCQRLCLFHDDLSQSCQMFLQYVTFKSGQVQPFVTPYSEHKVLLAAYVKYY